MASSTHPLFHFINSGIIHLQPELSPFLKRSERSLETIQAFNRFLETRAISHKSADNQW